VPFYVYFMLMVCLNFQISFVIDERLRGKGYKRKVTPFPLSHIKASPDIFYYQFISVLSGCFGDQGSHRGGIPLLFE
jgi:hypothetical protein